MRFLAISRLISILVSTLALGACIVDEWSEVRPWSRRVATEGSGSRDDPRRRDVLCDARRGAPKTGDTSATSNIKAFGGGTIKGTAVFTQHGGDVTVHIDLHRVRRRRTSFKSSAAIL